MGTLRSDFRAGMLDGPVARELRRAGEAWVETSRSVAPVRTGRLRNGIRVKPVGPKEVEVVSEAPYSEFVDGGTRNMPAQPYWLPGQRAAVTRLGKAKLDR